MTITARYPSRCSLCGSRITPGQQIEWIKGQPPRHTHCDASPVAPDPWLAPYLTGKTTNPVIPAPVSTPAVAHAATDASPALIRLSGGSGYGCHGWQVGQVILSGEQRRRESGPDGLVVVRTSHRYIRDDGMSFGVGDEQGYVYHAECRAATSEELRPAIDEAHGEALEMERAAELKRVEALFSAAPTPDVAANDGQQYVTVGEEVRLARTRHRIYGGGLWAVIDADWIWLCRGNGADGDCWAANNVRTQGAGAIGRRLPYDEALATRIRALREEVR